MIDKISLSKATGPHSVAPFLLNQIKEYISQPIADLVNMSLEQGIYIDDLKISKTIPIIRNKASDLDVQNIDQFL